MHPIVFERAVINRPHSVNEARDETSHINCLDIALDNLTQLLSDGSSTHPEGEGFGGIEIKEDTNENNGEDHVHFLLRVDAMRMILGLQGQRKHVCCKMHMSKIADAGIWLAPNLRR